MSGENGETTNSGTPLLVDGPDRARVTAVLAHGAGAPMDSDFMSAFAAGVAADGWRVVRFEFPYMVARRETGRRRPPDRESVLRATWHDVIRQVRAPRLVIGGKSLGGRIASLVADESPAVGLICLGYPFHPSGRTDRLRTEHLATIRTPTLILQGERDPLGNKAEVATYSLSSAIQLEWLPDGDHSLQPRKSSGRTVQQNWREAVEAVTRFLRVLAAD